MNSLKEDKEHRRPEAPKAKCSLNTVFSATVEQTENMECDMRPNCGIPQQTLCPPPWGGNCVLRKLVHIKLIKCLIDVVACFNNNDFGRGKIHWLKQFPKFDFSISSTVDV